LPARRVHDAPEGHGRADEAHEARAEGEEPDQRHADEPAEGGRHAALNELAEAGDEERRQGGKDVAAGARAPALLHADGNAASLDPVEGALVEPLAAMAALHRL